MRNHWLQRQRAREIAKELRAAQMRLLEAMLAPSQVGTTYSVPLSPAMWAETYRATRAKGDD
jgi:hypothetical protein